ncbi:hypothetical protein SAMN05444161_3144 [Rhizobiales bacterium GAS191]|nr:hypothetical protein SAMN05444161_3144 [Rhizobiales bacterium GAS191]
MHLHHAHTGYDHIKDFGPIVATLIVGFAAIWVAVRAYRRQVAPLVDQITFAERQAKEDRERRQEDRRRREYAIAWAVLLEAYRLRQSAARRYEAIQFAISRQGVQRNALLIHVNDFMRGGRADIALMHIQNQTFVRRLVQAVDEYNAAVETEQPVSEMLGLESGSLVARLIDPVRERVSATMQFLGANLRRQDNRSGRGGVVAVMC